MQDHDTSAWGAASDFRVKAALGVALPGLVFLTPFSLNNFVQGRHLLGLGSLGIVVLLAFNAWGARRGRYYPLLTLLTLVPGIIFFLMLSMRQQGLLGAFWCYPAVIAFYFTLPERFAWLANLGLFVFVVPGAMDLLEDGAAVRFAVTLLVASIFAAIFVRIIAVQQRHLETQAHTDPLTGLLNRTRLHDSLAQAIEQFRRAGTPMTLLGIDVDRFKAINDAHGHDAGDRVLRGIGEFLKERTRGADQAFRLGGEEFLLLLFDTDAERARVLAEALRVGIQSRPLLAGGTVTASFGLATLASGEDWESWMKRCDEKLYLAKSAGRNTVVN